MAGRRRQLEVGAAAEQPTADQQRAAGTPQEAPVIPPSNPEASSMSLGGNPVMSPRSLPFADFAKLQLPQASRRQHPPSASESPTQARNPTCEGTCTSDVGGSNKNKTMTDTAQLNLEGVRPGLMLGNSAGMADRDNGARCSTSPQAGLGGHIPEAGAHPVDCRAGSKRQGAAALGGHVLSGACAALLSMKQAAVDLGSIGDQDRVLDSLQAGCGPPPANLEPLAVDQQDVRKGDTGQSNRCLGCCRGQSGEDSPHGHGPASITASYLETQQQSKQAAENDSSGGLSEREKLKQLASPNNKEGRSHILSATRPNADLPPSCEFQQNAGSELAPHLGALPGCAVAVTLSNAEDRQAKGKRLGSILLRRRRKQSCGQAKAQGTKRGRNQSLQEASKRREPVVDHQAVHDSESQPAEQENSLGTFNGFAAKEAARTNRLKRKAVQVSEREAANGIVR